MDSRRNFLRGVFGGVVSGGLIVAATPKEISAFTKPLKQDAPLVLDRPPTVQRGGIVASGMHLYNELGELVAIITAMKMGELRPVDVTRHGDTELYYDEFTLQKFEEPEVEVRLVGRIEIGSNGWPQLRGVK